MRVIAGKAKGTKLIAPKGLGIRPITDRIKTSLFDILGNRLASANVLDLFAGSGSLGIEALSRGAYKTIFVEINPLAIKAINRNLERVKLAPQAEIHFIDAYNALSLFKESDRRFDLIFLDPPYKIKITELVLIFQILPFCLQEKGLAILRHRPDLPEMPTNKLKLTDRRHYKDVSLSFYEKG